MSIFWLTPEDIIKSGSLKQGFAFGILTSNEYAGVFACGACHFVTVWQKRKAKSKPPSAT
jgi:hypothetical protein